MGGRWLRLYRSNCRQATLLQILGLRCCLRPELALTPGIRCPAIDVFEMLLCRDRMTDLQAHRASCRCRADHVCHLVATPCTVTIVEQVLPIQRTLTSSPYSLAVSFQLWRGDLVYGPAMDRSSTSWLHRCHCIAFPTVLPFHLHASCR